MSDNTRADEMDKAEEVPDLDPESIPLPADDGISSQNEPAPPKIKTSQQGIKNAQKRLRAFSIQKKLPILPKTLAKSTVTGTTVVIGKLSSTKTTPKVQDPDAESRRLPKPPKPGVKKNNTLAESYSELQKRTLSDIENMKRKMELVELGIPLGLICPPPNSDTAMPTKAMPPIKSFLDPSKVDELISEAKKAKAAGKQFKFDYQRLLPDYDNPFQRKKEESKQEELDIKKIDFYKSRNRHRWDESSKDKDKDRRKTDRHHDYKKSFDYRKEYRDKDPKDKEKVKEKVKEKDKYEKKINKESMTTNEKDSKEADVNLSDYLVCDSWSLDTEEKTSSPKPDESIVRNAEMEDQKTKIKDPMEMLRDSISAGKKKSDEKMKSPTCNNNNSDPKIGKMKKIQPVMDSFRYEIDPDDERDILDIFDDSQDFAMYSKSQRFFRNKSSYRPSPRNSIQSFNINEITNDNSQSSSLDEYSSKSNDNFLESVINEIKQEEISDETSQDRKFLVEYELSPEKLSDNIICNTPEKSENAYLKSGSITPDLEGSYYGSQRSDSSESGFISTESGYKSTESGYKSSDSYRISELRGSEFDYYPTEKMSKATIVSLETWSFVLKICQPLLFRHDNNRCYRSTMTNPKLWYTENPKICNCVKDRVIVYDELETCKMNLVDRVYGCDQYLKDHFTSFGWCKPRNRLFDSPCLKSRTWYSRINQCLIESVSNLTSNWETDDSSQNSEKLPSSKNYTYDVRNEMCDGHRNEVALDREYEKFMEAVLPESESKNKNIVQNCKSNTPTKSQKDLNLKKGNDSDNIIKEKTAEDSRERVKRKRKKMRKLSTDDWSEDSDLKKERSHKKIKAGKRREKKKKKDFSSSDSDDSFTDDDRKKHHTSKKKDAKNKSKTERRKYLSKKRSHKNNKEKKKLKKLKEIEEDDTDSEEDMRKAKESKEKKRTRKKALKRKKKKQRKKRARTKSTSTSESSTSSSSTSSVTSSDSSSSSSDSESEREKVRSKKKREKEERRKRKRKFESIAQSEEFDENILNNIKKERLTDDERSQNKTSDIQDFSPRRQTTSIQRQEIINIKELHNDIVASNLIHIKQEVVEEELDIPEPPKPVPPVPAETELPKTDEQKTNIDNKEPMQDTMTPNHFDKHEEVQKVSAVNHTIIEVTQQESSTAKEPLMETTIERLDETKLLSDNNYPQTESTVYPQAHDYTGETNINENASQNTFGYEQCYEHYEQMDYQQQSDIHAQMGVEESRPIETLVSASGCRGEIKCDWRPGQRASRAPPARPSRWGLKPNEANIVLSGGTTHDDNVVYPIRSILDSGAAESHTYRIETISTTRVSKETASPVLGYDEAYEDTYGAADRLAYGDCFASAASVPAPGPAPAPASTPRSSRSLDARIDRALRETVLGLVTKEATGEGDDAQSGPEKGILASKNGARASKRVSFADGYAPGQDSDAEPPPKKKKKKKVGVRGCAWPCPASHPDHVPLWDALPPPDPPPGSPPPRAHYLLAGCGATAPLPALKVI